MSSRRWPLGSWKYTARCPFLGGRVLFDRDPARTAGVLERILAAYFDGEYHRRMRAEALERRRESRRG